MFQLDQQQVKVTSFNPRAEKNGDENVPAGDLRVEAAYRRLRSQHHPDRGGDAERFHAVQKAFDEATA
jgi:hypothetical protein